MFLVSQRDSLLVILFLFVSILSLVYFTTFRNSRDKTINLWGLSWIMYGVSLVFNIILISQPSTLLLAAGKQFFDLMNSLFLLAGTYSFLKRKFPAYWIQFTAINVIWIGLAVYYELSYLMITLLASIFFSIVAVVNGILLQTTLGKNILGRVLVFSVFLIWGAYKAYYPYLYPALSSSSIGYSVELILANLMNLAIMIIYLRKIQEELIQSETLFRVFAENARDMIYVYRISPNMGYLYVSPACKEILGYGQEYFYQNNMMLASITHPEDRIYLDALFDPKANLNELITLRLRHKKGYYVWTEQKTTFQYDEDRKTLKVEGILRDITDRMKVEEDLRLAESSRQAFLTDVSHELRTPITSIVGYLSVLRNSHGKPADIAWEEREANYLEVIYKKALQLQRLVQDLFQLTQYNAGQGYFNFSQIRIQELIEQTVEKYRIDVSERKLEFRLEYPENQDFLNSLIIVDEERMDQVFTNIVFNAIKYTAPGGEISIHLDYWDADSRHDLMVSVKDTGEGIKQKDLAKIFDRFYRSDTQVGNKEGSGLGLTISKEIIKGHKGTIWAESEPGEGSTFLFTIPIYQDGRMDERRK